MNENTSKCQQVPPTSGSNEASETKRRAAEAAGTARVDANVRTPVPVTPDDDYLYCREEVTSTGYRLFETKQKHLRTEKGLQ